MNIKNDTEDRNYSIKFVIEGTEDEIDKMINEINKSVKAIAPLANLTISKQTGTFTRPDCRRKS